MEADFLPPPRPYIHVVDDDGFYDHYYWDRQEGETVREPLTREGGV